MSPRTRAGCGSTAGSIAGSRTLANSHLMKIVRKGEVRVSGRRADVSTRLAAGESVRVPPLRPAAGRAPAIRRASPGDREAIRAMTLFEDRDVIVLNKPYGLAVQGGSGTKRHIDGMLEALADKNGERPVLVHRLDRDTSGVLLDRQVAKDRRPSSARSSARAARARSTGRWSKACRSRRRGASRCFSPRARAWATRAARGRAGRISSGCGS